MMRRSAVPSLIASPTVGLHLEPEARADNVLGKICCTVPSGVTVCSVEEMTRTV